MTRPTILLNPGPVTLTDRVRRALLREDQCHREPDFAQLTLDIKARLARVYPQAELDYVPVILTGSGTCAVEAMLSSLIPKNGKTLVVANGVYGERMAAMIESHGKPMELIKSDWLAPMDLAEVERRLKLDPGFTHVVAVHNETTTGRLNDLPSLGALCRRYDKRLLVDAVSSFGAEAIEFEHWNLDGVAATANKCLHGVPGMALVLVRRRVLEESRSQSSTLYLDLYRYYKEQVQGFSPFTPAVHAAFALQEALRELEDQGGWCARNRRYLALASAIRDTLSDLGVESLLDGAVYSSMISSFHLPQGLTYQRLHDFMRKAGFVIYAGQGGLSNKIFRIANMGDIQDDDRARLIAALKDIFGHR